MKKKSKIVFEANLETNYVFHMLSVATCGYNNDYGRKYKTRYDVKDLESLKRHEGLLTVCGGQFIGNLYYLLVSSYSYNLLNNSPNTRFNTVCA